MNRYVLTHKGGSIFAAMFGAVAMMGVVGVAAMNMIGGPITTASKVTHQNMAQNDLLMNAKIVVMNASTRPNQGDEDGDGYVEPVPFIPTSASSCNITLPAGSSGGCLPGDIGAILTDPWGTQYMYCVWDHGDPASSTNRINGEDSTSGAVLAIISAGPNKRFETPCRAYDGNPATNDDAINPDGNGDDLIQIYTYAAAVAGSGGLWELKQNEPETAIINKKLEIGDMATGMGFAFDTETGQGEFPYVKTDFIASKTGGSTPVTMVNNIALDGNWLSGDGGNEGVFVTANGNVGIGTATPDSRLHVTAYPVFETNWAFDSVRFKNNKSYYTGTDHTWHFYPQGNTGAPTLNQSYFRIGTRNEETGQPTSHITISNDGNFGIGTVRPSEKLVIGQDVGNLTDIATTVVIGDSEPTGGSRLYLARNSNNFGSFQWSNANNYWGFDTKELGQYYANTFVLKSGNVGIGTITPQSKLDVSDGAISITNSTHPNARLQLRNGTSIADAWMPTMIGTPIGNRPLGVYSTLLPEDDVATTYPAMTFLARVGGEMAINNRKLFDWRNHNQILMTILANGNVGIQTSAPTDTLHVNGNIRSSRLYLNASIAANAGHHLSLIRDDTTKQMFLGFIEGTEQKYNIGVAANTHNLLFTSYPASGGAHFTFTGGNLGINTSAPSHALHVNGIARSTQANFVTSSDVRVKTNIHGIENGLDVIGSLRPVTYEYTDEYQNDNADLGGVRRGFIAQEVEEILPDAVSRTQEQVGDKTVEDFRVLNNDDFVPLLVRAVQELEAENKRLQQRLEKLEQSVP